MPIDFKPDLDFQLDFQPEDTGYGANEAIGILENIGMVATGAASMMGPAQIAAGLKTLNEATQGQGAHFLKNFEEMTGAMTYEPKTEKGQEYSKPVTEFINRNLVPLLGVPIHPPVPRVKGKEPLIEDLKKAREEEKGVAPKESSIDFQELKATEGEGGQMALFDIPEGGRMMPNKFEATPGDWRIDENGIPIKADLSMDVASTESLLQKGFWGDELAPKSEQEAKPITQAMDETQAAARNATELPEAVAQRDLFEQQTNLLRGEIEAPGELKSAIMEAEGWRIPRSQRGAIDPEVFKEGYQALTRKLSRLTDLLANDSVWQSRIRSSLNGDYMKNSDGSPMVLLHGTFRDIKGELLPMEQGFHAGFTTSPHMFTQNAYPRAASKYGNLQKPYARADQTKNNGQLHPVIIKEGNYPYLPFDANDFTPAHLVESKKFKEWLEYEYANKGYDRNSLNSDLNYIKGVYSIKEANQRLTDILKGRLGVDGFFYMNIAESPHGHKSLRLSEKYRNPYEGTYPLSPQAFDAISNLQNISKHPTSFVTWNPKNYVSIFNTPPKANNVIRSPGNRQLGGINKEAFKRDHIQKILKEKDNNFIPNDPDIATGLEIAKQEADGKALTYMESGSTLASMKRKSTAVRMASQLIQNAYKRADLKIRETIFPVEQAFRKLSSLELKDLADIFKEEMFSEHRFNHELLESKLSTKQLLAYDKMREAFHESWKIQNEKRTAEGKPSITELEWYLSSRWEGDFRRPVYQVILDKSGNPKIKPDGSFDKKLVWYLAADSKRGLEKQSEALKKERPDLEIDSKNDHRINSWGRKTDIESAYSTMLDTLGRDDPAVEKLQAYIQNLEKTRGAEMFKQTKHFLEKGNVRGFVGDRPGTSPKAEALAMFQQQITYMKNSFKWAEYQTAAEGIKKIVSDPTLVETQPNNIKYIREYWKNAIGYGESRVMKALEDTIKETGYSLNSFDKGVGGMKSYFILNKLAVNAGYTISNLIQTSMVLPHLLDLRTKGYHGNPISALAVGTTGGITMATAHYLKSMGGKAEEIPVPFLREAFKYAEDNGVTTRSIYDEAPIESSFSKIGQIGHLAGKTMTIPETFVRAVAFMTFADFLRTSGKFKNNMELFQAAEERTNAAMVDYRASERPMVFSKAGSAGNFLNTLQTYGFNFHNQHSYFLREAFNGNILPWTAFIGLQFALAGANGVPFADDIYRTYMYLKDKGLLGAQLPAKWWAQINESSFWQDPKLWVLEHFGEPTIYGVLSDKTGLGLSTRVSAPTVGQMITSPGGAVADVAKQVGSVATAAFDPTNKTKLAQAGMNVTPPGLQGLLETAPFMEGLTYVTRPDGSRVYQRNSDLADARGVYQRSPEEDTIRKFGLRSQKETATRDMTYSLSSNTAGAQHQAPRLVDEFYDAVKRGDKKSAQEINELYTRLTGSSISSEQLENQILDNYLTQIEKSQSSAKSITALKNAARMQKILKELEK